MTAEELKEHALAKAQEFGAETDANESRFNTVKRVNINKKDAGKGKEKNDKDVPFFAFINPDQPASGTYSDISFVVFPGKDSSLFLVTLTVGSLGYAADYELATLPYLRRMFMPLLSDDENSLCKTSFIDIESCLISDFVKEHPEFPKLKEKYGKVILAARLLDSENPKDIKTLDAWLARYADVRGWATNETFRKNFQNALKDFNPEKKTDVLTEVKDLITKHQYVVLQGAPGTGKTYTAVNRIAKEYKHVFIEQFHAETTYSDFVYGLTPDLSSAANGVKFVEKKGILLQAIERAIEDKNERVLLIIDEINRANLSNVLGEVFFLFEKNVKRTIPINVGGIKLTKLPDNLYVIATMNTADRSLAVVDFALRRRFAWYTLRPQKLNKKDLNEGEQFFDNYFTEFDNIFAKYATDDELNLQPGHSYFIAENEADMRDKIIYGLMPLIKEYLNQGYLVKARDAFANLFQRLVQKQLFE